MENNKLTVGVDPDSEAHGVAFYFNGKLTEIKKMTTVDLISRVAEFVELNVYNRMSFSIEDVMANQFVYARNQHSNKAAQSKIAMHIGRCQQAQVELMRWLDHYGIPYALHKPQKGNWADKRELFERITGWTKQSNEDTRAAAYFGYLEASK